MKMIKITKKLIILGLLLLINNGVCMLPEKSAQPLRRTLFKPIERIKKSELPQTNAEAQRLDYNMYPIVQVVAQRRTSRQNVNNFDMPDARPIDGQARRSSLLDFTYQPK